MPENQIEHIKRKHDECMKIIDDAVKAGALMRPNIIDAPDQRGIPIIKIEYLVDEIKLNEFRKGGST